MKYYKKEIGGIPRRYPTADWLQDYYNLTKNKCLKIAQMKIMEGWGVVFEEVAPPDKHEARVYLMKKRMEDGEIIESMEEKIG